LDDERYIVISFGDMHTVVVKSLVSIFKALQVVANRGYEVNDRIQHNEDSIFEMSSRNNMLIPPDVKQAEVALAKSIFEGEGVNAVVDKMGVLDLFSEESASNFLKTPDTGDEEGLGGESMRDLSPGVAGSKLCPFDWYYVIRNIIRILVLFSLFPFSLVMLLKGNYWKSKRTLAFFIGAFFYFFMVLSIWTSSDRIERISSQEFGFLMYYGLYCVVTFQPLFFPSFRDPVRNTFIAFFFFRVLTIPTALKLYGIPFICQMFGIVSGLLHNYLKHQPFEPFLFLGSLLGLVFGFQEIAKRVILILATEDFGEILILPNSMDRIRYDNLEMRKKMDDTTIRGGKVAPELYLETSWSTSRGETPRGVTRGYRQPSLDSVYKEMVV